MNKRALIIGGAVIIILAGAWGISVARTSTIDRDTTITGDYEVKIGRKVVMKNGATLTVEGQLKVDGELKCENGPLNVIAQGDVEINNKLSCSNRDKDSNISFVAESGFNLNKDAKISSSGSIQIVGRKEDLAQDQSKLDAWHEDVGTDSGQGFRVGPLTENLETNLNAGEIEAKENAAKDTANIYAKSYNNELVKVSSNGFSLVKTANAQGLPVVVIAGKISVETPKKGVKQIVVFNFPMAGGIKISDFELEGPAGRNGDDDKNNSCSAKGGDGEDAFRFLAITPDLTVNNFTLKLGSGGNGGAAETNKDCGSAVATGGKGGSPGNFKMIGSEKFEITGAFLVVPGRGGDGGSAKAFGKDSSSPEEKGGDATAAGGRGANNKKSLSIAGEIAGTSNIQFASAYGGNGGDAEATGGSGGNGKGCGSNGGAGGKATATGGLGGDASLTLAGGATRTPEAEDKGGNGGDVNSKAGSGGSGGDCDSKGAGGNGGNGGDAKSSKGLGGVGKTSNGEDGTKGDESGGNGGNGGSGCGEGKGGTGGVGDPKGVNGQPGKNMCEEKKEETFTDPSKQKIKVIDYNGKLLPVEQLIIESEQGCDGGQEHWHAKAGVVTATDGSKVPDPGPQCGYGKTKDKPVREIEVQANASIDTEVGNIEVRMGF